MATRKGINISGNYAAPHILHALFIYVFLGERAFLFQKQKQNRGT